MIYNLRFMFRMYCDSKISASFESICNSDKLLPVGSLSLKCPNGLYSFEIEEQVSYPGVDINPLLICYRDYSSKASLVSEYDYIVNNFKYLEMTDVNEPEFNWYKLYKKSLYFCKNSSYDIVDSMRILLCMSNPDKIQEFNNFEVQFNKLRSVYKDNNDVFLGLYKMYTTFDFMDDLNIAECRYVELLNNFAKNVIDVS